MKKFMLLTLLALFTASFSATAFASSHHHHKHHKTRNGTPNHKPA
jgi:hypothetical protein